MMGLELSGLASALADRKKVEVEIYRTPVRRFWTCWGARRFAWRYSSDAVRITKGA